MADEEVVDYVQALHDYKATEPTCLSFRKGDTIAVHIKDKSGWWDGTLGSNRGWFPSNYVQVIPESRLRPMPAVPLPPVPSSQTSTANASSGRPTSQSSTTSALSATSASSIASPGSTTSSSLSRTNPSRMQLEATLSQLMEEAKALGEEEDDTATPTADGLPSVPSIPEDEFVDDSMKSRQLDLPKSEDSHAESGSTGNLAELPPFWGRKTTPQGVVYYYNTQSNQTTYSLEEVQRASLTHKRSTTLLKEVSSKDLASTAAAPVRSESLDKTDFPAFKDQAPLVARSLSDRTRASGGNWIPGPQTLLDPKVKPTWEVLINNILRAISDLNHSAKTDSRVRYVGLANQVVRAIRDMLASSGLTSKDAPAFQSNRQLRNHHYHIMSSLSKLMLAAKVASGLWPPPDAVNKMRYQAGQVLLAVRHFVTIAQDVSSNLVPVSPGSLSNVALSVSEFDQRGAELSDIEFVSRLDTHSDAIITSIATLVNTITQDSRISEELIEQARDSVTEIGQLLSLIEDIPLQQMELQDMDARAKEVIVEFKRLKEVLYSTVNDLVTAARTTMDEFAPPNALGTLLETTTLVLQAVEDLLMVTKLVIDQKDLLEQRTLQEEAELFDDERRRDSELSILQRRAMSLTFLHGSEENNAMGGTASSQTSTPRDRTASTPIMLRSSSSTNVTPKGSATLAPGGNRPAVGNGGVYRSVSSASLPDSNYQPRDTQAPKSAVEQSSSFFPGEAKQIGGSNSKLEKFFGESTSGAPNPRLEKFFGESVGPPGSKLEKFFGEQSPKLKKKPDDESTKKYWFLGSDYLPNDVSFNMEGQVNGGTLPGLVERLTLHDHPVDPTFSQAFMMLFHEFATGKEFLMLLMKRFTMTPPPQLNPEELRIWQERKQTPARLRVYNALRSWLENFWVEELDGDCLEVVLNFASKEMMEATPPLAMRMIELVQRKMSGVGNTPKMGRRSVQSMQSTISGPLSAGSALSGTNGQSVAESTNSAPAPPPILPRSLKKFGILDLDPLEVARQLTIMESRLYNSIEPIELVGQKWTKKAGRSGAPNVRALTNMANQITGWVAASILTEVDPKRRASLIKQFLKIGDRCLHLNNFNTLIAILSSLNSSAIIRLKRSWELVPAKYKTSLDQMKAATDHSRNYSEYRANLKRVQGPCLPFLGVFLTDLTFTEDGNPPTRVSARGNLINIDKYIKVYQVIQEVQRFQTPYHLTEVPEIQNWLGKELHTAGEIGANELYQISLNIEPRESEMDETQRDMDSKLRMLQKAGLL
ncbi:ras guanine nucleotide exchange factor domain-containing protein [Fimicolochytrium jonesii]|uniref:ras guanine nucleotide exchange factor domain-containing protein n=1 Tax=Fimicolochytrium jonesii TaxID=1396493 RepID=UPI0022FDD0D0|nr:ras guanine nucleotide exchange factor domain-containing protein [Fimicolochytrium jonesii]KAI8819872.1 ras guanine nucleotide exchange factor domain-containing protein [Fimicolochytrium jonesii]